MVSFTFDDFPRSALESGGEILERFGVKGTYYAALGLLGGDSPSGPIVDSSGLKKALEDGHEVGCHTFSHCHSWQTPTLTFEDSVRRNAAALNELVPGAQFRSFSYPLSEPRPLTKRAISRYFQCCRAGGQSLNEGRTDLNQLNAYFLERSKNGIQEIKDLVDESRDAHGWIIFATHDIAAHPSPYGCTPEFFESVVQYAVESGALILPVIEALERIQGARLKQK